MGDTDFLNESRTAKIFSRQSFFCLYNNYFFTNKLFVASSHFTQFYRICVKYLIGVVAWEYRIFELQNSLDKESVNRQSFPGQGILERGFNCRNKVATFLHSSKKTARLRIYR